MDRGSQQRLITTLTPFPPPPPPSRSNSLPPRFIGLALTPLIIITDVTLTTYNAAGDFIGSLMYCFGILITWWYWVFVMPWLAVAMGWVGVAYSCCCGIVEYAGL